MKKIFVYFIVISILIPSSFIFAEELIQFKSGEKAIASDVNQNFQILLNKINLLEQKLKECSCCNYTANDWQSLNEGTITTASVGNRTNVTKIVSNNQGTDSGAFLKIGPYNSGIVEISWDWYVTDNFVPAFYPSERDIYIEWGSYPISDDNVFYDLGNWNTTKIGSMYRGDWHNVVYTINLDKKTFSIVVDGAALVNKQAMFTDINTLSSVYFRNTGGDAAVGNSEQYIDNFQVNKK